VCPLGYDVGSAFSLHTGCSDRDEMVLMLNREALSRLRCLHKQLDLIRGATHLFEEAGTLEQVAVAAADWFEAYLAPETWNENTSSAQTAPAS